MKRAAPRHPGQAIILVAVFAITLLVFLGLAIDSGMLYVERRHLQNTVDAACLAAATDMAMGEDETTARATAFSYIDNNLGANANLAFDLASLDPDVPPLTDGIIKVTVRIRAFSYFMRLVGIETYNVMARARCGLTEGGGLSPIAINRYPGYDASDKFEAGVSTDETLPQFYSGGKRGDRPLRVRDVLEEADNDGTSSRADATINKGDPAVNGIPWCAREDQDDRNWPDWPSLGDPALRTGPYADACPEASSANPGPEIIIAGRGAIPSSSNPSFTGPVMLDVRNISAGPDYYNGVNSGTALAVYKDLVAKYILTEYPGPSFPTGTQLGILPGVSAGIIVEALDARYDEGDPIGVLVYDGTIRRKGDFELSVTCLPLQGPRPAAGGGKAASCNNDGRNDGTYVYREVPPSSPLNARCEYSGEYYIAHRSYSGFSGSDVKVQTTSTDPRVLAGLYPATYVVRLAEAASALRVDLTARISDLTGTGTDFGPAQVRWLNAATTPPTVLADWRNPNIPVRVNLPANTPMLLHLEVIQTASTTITTTACTTPVRIPIHVDGAQNIQVTAASVDTGTHHSAFGTLGMYFANTGSPSPFRANDYFLSTGGDPTGTVAPGDTLEMPLRAIGANGDTELTYTTLRSRAPTEAWSVDPPLPGLAVAVVSDAAGDPALRVTVPPGTATTPVTPGWYTIQVQLNSTPAHSLRFNLLVQNPSNPSIDEWVTVLCYATFRIENITSNAVSARAISGCQSLDEAGGGWTSRLLPWDD